MNKLIIPGELVDLNKYINAERSNKYAAAKMKEEATGYCFMIAKKLEPINKPVEIIFTWVTKDEKKDPDNIAFAKKFILDGLVDAGVLKNDGRKQIKGFQDQFITDKEYPRIEVELKILQ